MFAQAQITAFVDDRRGGSLVQALILVVVLALGAAGGVRLLAGGVSSKLDCTGEAIASLAPGGAPCQDDQGAPALVPAAADAPLGAAPGETVPVETVPVATAAVPPLRDPDPVPGPTPAPGTTPTPSPTPGSGPTPAADPSPVPSPQPGPEPQPPEPEENRFTPEDEELVKRLIADALARHNGDISLAFADLRDQRQQPENFFDTNLAIAADYLRARLETQRSGPIVARDQVEAYILLKRTVGVPKEGPGPVSPASDLQAKYMRQGVEDEAATMSFFELAFWSSPAGVALGTAKAGASLLRGDV